MIEIEIERVIEIEMEIEIGIERLIVMKEAIEK